MSDILTPENAAAAASHIIHIKGPTIAMGDGSYFDFLDPHATTMTIEDYAYALAYTVRFRGQCKQDGKRVFYGVGEHVCRLAVQMLRDGHGKAHAFSGLMHESDEVPFPDMPGPVKPLLPDFRALAKLCGAGIDSRFGVRMFDPALVKRYDLKILATEKRDLMAHTGDHEWHNGGGGRETLAGFEPFPDRIVPFAHPDMAAVNFLELYDHLGGMR